MNAYMDKNNREYSNDDITVSWRPGKCIHATICYTRLREVFDPRKRPWVNMNAAPTSKIIEIVDDCPTDALTYKWNSEEKRVAAEQKKEEAKKVELKPVDINLMKDGPIVVEGSFSVIDENGIELRSMKMASFCRCGESRNMPYCDGTHRKIGFTTNEK